MAAAFMASYPRAAGGAVEHPRVEGRGSHYNTDRCGINIRYAVTGRNDSPSPLSTIPISAIHWPFAVLRLRLSLHTATTPMTSAPIHAGRTEAHRITTVSEDAPHLNATIMRGKWRPPQMPRTNEVTAEREINYTPFGGCPRICPDFPSGLDLGPSQVLLISYYRHNRLSARVEKPRCRRGGAGRLSGCRMRFSSHFYYTTMCGRKQAAALLHSGCGPKTTPPINGGALEILSRVVNSAAEHPRVETRGFIARALKDAAWDST